MFSRQSDKWYQVKTIRSDRSVLMRICFVTNTGLDYKQTLYVLLKRMVLASMKRQNYETSVKNVIVMSRKTVSSDIIPLVNQKGNTLYDIFEMKVAFSGL